MFFIFTGWQRHKINLQRSKKMGKEINRDETGSADRESRETMTELLVDWERDLLLDIIPFLIQHEYVSSEKELQQMLVQAEIQKDGEVVDDWREVLINGDILKIGRKPGIRITK